MQPQHVVLASASPRRRDLLNLIGIDHIVLPADIDETPIAGESPEVYTDRLSRQKAESIAATHNHGSDTLVVAADTTVVLDAEILGKPSDRADAFDILKKLNGRTHTVVTGIAVAYRGALISAVESVQVTFRELSDDEILAYIETGEPMDKAGAYGIQGFGATIVRRIEGDYFAVMGLSLVRLVELLKEVGVTYRFAQQVS